MRESAVYILPCRLMLDTGDGWQCLAHRGSGVYCREIFPDQYALQLHIASRHPQRYRVLARTLDHYTRHWWLIYQKENDTPRPVRWDDPWGWTGWRPLVWKVTEYRKLKNTYVRDVPLLSYRKHIHGTLDDVGWTLANEVVQNSENAGKEVGKWLERKLAGHRCLVVPVLELRLLLRSRDRRSLMRSIMS